MKHENNGSCGACKETLKNATPALVAWFSAEQARNPELHCSCAYRDSAGQAAALASGNSKASFGQGPHNYKPSMAIDLYHRDSHGNATWPFEMFRELATRKPHDIEWGADWNDNGRTDDEKFKDSPHFQIKNWPKLVKNYPHGN